MASYYVRSLAAGAGTGADWTNAYTTLAAAFSGKAAGDSFFVADDHAETQGSAMVLTSPGTAASPCFVYVTNTLATPPLSANLSSGATISVTGNFSMGIGSASSVTYYYASSANGLIFNCGTGNSSAASMIIASGTTAIVHAVNCAFRLLTTSTAAAILIGGTATQNAAKAILVGSTFQFGAAQQPIIMRAASLIWKNTPSAITGATLPTTLFSESSPQGTTILMEGVDLSALGSGKTIVGAIGAPSTYILKDCKLGASVTVAATPSSQGAAETMVLRSDSGATNYRSEKYRYEATQTVETTIVRTGGASDGTTSLAWKLVTTANSKWVLPFEAIPIAIWNDSTSAITTLTIYGTTTGGGVPKDDEIWVDVEYLGSGSTPQGSFITSSKADNLAASAATNNSSDASTWGGSGAGNGFKIVVPSFTPGMKGPINITVRAAKASATYYIDPKPSISGVTVSKSEILAPGVYANEISSGGGISRARAASGF